MFHALRLGFTRGVFLGIAGGLLAGAIEGVSIVRDSPTMRAALVEAALYAVVVDALAAAGICGVLGAALSVAGRGRITASTVVVLHVSLATATVSLLAGLVWTFRAAANEGTGLTVSASAAVAFVAIVLGLAVYPLAKSFAPPLLGSMNRAGKVAFALAVGLALVFPVQVLMEARQHAPGHEAPPRDRPTLDIATLPDDLDLLDQALKGSSGRRSTVPAPNVLLITVDALRADHLGACGNGWIVTPSLDLLARHSALSCNTYTQQPQTNPAIASLLTSTYPAVHGVRMHMVDRLADSFETLAELLQRQGFRTAAVLPWTSLEPAFSGFHQGFHTYEAFVVNEPPLLRNPATAALAGIYRRVTDQIALGTAVEAILGLRQGTEAEIDGRADVTANAAVNWFANFSSSRFFLWVHYFDPHYPFTPPEPWDQLYDQGYTGRYDGSMGFVYEMREGIFDPEDRDVQYLRALYASEVTYADHYIGKMLSYMAQLGLLDNTIIVLTADHGESLGERGNWWPNGEYWLHGDDLYNSGIQVPLIVYDPRGSRAQRRLTAPVQHIDIMPTVLDLLGLPIPHQVQGKSIVPLIAGTDDGAGRFAVSTLSDDSYSAIITADGWKLIAGRRSDDRQLFYLATDPDERSTLTASFPGRALALARQLESWAQTTNAALASTSREEDERALTPPLSQREGANEEDGRALTPPLSQRERANEEGGSG